MKISIIIGLFVVLTSCNHNPETILGIQLGKPLKEEKSKASNVLIKKTFENKDWDAGIWEYTTIGDKDHYLESYITLFDCMDINGEKVVTSVLSAYVNPYFKHWTDDDIRIKHTPWTLHISEQDALWLIQLFQKKYGSTDIKRDISNGYHLKWDRKDLDISLDINLDLSDNINKYYHAKASYSYPQNIKNKVCKQTIKY